MPAIAASEIRWGTGYDNVLSFDYPQGLDDTRTWRRPAPGSRRTRNPAGVTDAWINSREFCLAGRARWFSRSTFGGLGLQDFLDWAGEGNTFRFLPDNRYSSFYVDNCYLDSPFDDPQPQLEQADGSQTVDIVIRQQAFDFTLAMRGLMFEYAPGKSLTDPAIAVNSRGSTATQIARDGTVVTVASGALRDRHFINGARTTLLEKARQNLQLHTEDIDVGFAIRGAGSFATGQLAPDGTLSAVKFTPGSATDYAGANNAIGVNINTRTFSVSVWLKSVNATKLASYGLLINGDAASGVNSVGITIDNTWRRYQFTAVGTVVSTSFYSYFQSGGGDASAFYIWGFQVEEAVTASSYIKNVGVANTRSADFFKYPFLFTPQELTVYVKGIELGGGLDQGVNGLVAIGASTDASFFIFNNGSNQYAAMHRRATDVFSASAGGQAFGQQVEIRAVLSAGGAASVGQSLGGGAESVAGPSAALPLAAAWFDTNIYIGERSGATGLFGIQLVRIAPGTRTLAEMRAA